MSQPAKKRPAPPTETHVADGDGSGRFVIAHRVAPMLPPSDGSDEVLSLDAIGGLELPDAIDSTPPPAPNTTSGVFASGQGPRDAESDAIADGLASMRPYYTTAEQRNERAELFVEDLSLSFDNPLAASSLVPPPRKPVSVAKVIGIAAALIAVGSGSWFATRALENAQTQHASAAVAPHLVAVAQAPVAAVPAAKVEAPVAVQAPTQVAAPAPVEAKAAPVASTPAHERVTAPVAHQSNGDEVKAALSAVLKNQAAEPAAPAAAQPVATRAAPEAPVATTAAATPAAPAPVAADALGALPDLPTREEIVAGFEQSRGAFETCAAGKHGLVKIQANIANSGRVASAMIDGVFVGTPEGSCIARAVRSARFPQFSQASLKVSYPIAL